MSSLKESEIRTYTELSKLQTFEERFRYLQLKGNVGDLTFGFDRYINQRFYHSREWKNIRDQVILRDFGCDLGVRGHEIYGRVLIHHMNPLSVDDIVNATEYLMNPEYLVTTNHETHNAIHYGDDSLLSALPAQRSMYDTCPWKRKDDEDGEHTDICKKTSRHYRGL